MAASNFKHSGERPAGREVMAIQPLRRLVYRRLSYLSRLARLYLELVLIDFYTLLRGHTLPSESLVHVFVIDVLRQHAERTLTEEQVDLF